MKTTSARQATGYEPASIDTGPSTIDSNPPRSVLGSIADHLSAFGETIRTRTGRRIGAGVLALTLASSLTACNNEAKAIPEGNGTTIGGPQAPGTEPGAPPTAETSAAPELTPEELLAKFEKEGRVPHPDFKMPKASEYANFLTYAEHKELMELYFKYLEKFVNESFPKDVSLDDFPPASLERMKQSGSVESILTPVHLVEEVTSEEYQAKLYGDPENSQGAAQQWQELRWALQKANAKRLVKGEPLLKLELKLGEPKDVNETPWSTLKMTAGAGNGAAVAEIIDAAESAESDGAGPLHRLHGGNPMTIKFSGDENTGRMRADYEELAQNNVQ